jgi:phage gpG-like protein
VSQIIVIDPTETDPYAELVGKLKNPERILKQIGVLMESASTDAFQRQEFGTFKWPGRYPNQTAPFLNIAGAVADWAAGGDVKARRFQNRPALFDTGALAASIRSQVQGSDRVAVGSALDHAAIHQWGGVSTQPVTKETKQKVAKFLLTERGKPFRDKLRFLLQPNRNALETEVVQRPFLGITSELEEDIVSTVEELVAAE